MERKEIIRGSKRLSFLLRHQKDNPKLDEHGYALVKDVLAILGLKMDDLENIVNDNDKKRFEFSDDKRMIRARQGHTVDVDVELIEAEPPKFLYHGTSTKNLGLIMESGIQKMKRLYVHLTENKRQTKMNGQRYGKPCIIVVDCERMVADGIKFLRSRNDVWLVDYVDPRYFSEIIYFNWLKEEYE